ncbi:hypothetical protein KQS06HV_100169 [Klebsiella quasipneumoniae subsp. similipneumoniae]|nr:hypothetical protein KQS06HV_100169 [Klebsiella quasipneumoniae subsp. similipneumoniae]
MTYYLETPYAAEMASDFLRHNSKPAVNYVFADEVLEENLPFRNPAYTRAARLISLFVAYR